jgi:hypothetical protein
MAKIDMTGNGKKVTITSGRKPLEGVDFSGQQKCDNLWKELTLAHERAKYYTKMMMRAEHDRNNSTDKFTITKASQDLEHYRGRYNDSKRDVSKLENILKVTGKRRD